MTAIVIDASVSASWLLPDETNSFASEIFENRSSCQIYVPAIWDYEIRNMLITNERRSRISVQAADAAFAFLSELGLVTDRAADWTRVTALSRQFSLTVYDAAYLELADRLDLGLATFDKALISAADRLGRLARQH